ncbi:Bax inhibitor-1/YccA family protein [Oceanispirochaeta sp.]|jgi:FtsH-binding integral membrane protein|uniref:Bax inhibitor-1/YccA family protein n=1 Tax=Oceanispirochaeta sp. TaxID=2035350 RepID=UPI0026340E5F|nr:Bax inhibitor-1/YccA family protein [Oceanispirochaeta sp.]MDA3957954.1 Bax inhibitor-1/YccA family protein [Oceanispirochaeta sp.]
MNQNFTSAGSFQATQDRTILKNVYLWMTAGLFLTAIVARGFLVTGLYRNVMSNPLLMFGLIIIELVLVFRLASKINTMSVGAAITTFGVYAGLNGINMSTIFLMYNLGTITTAFVSTAALFGTMSLWAVTTKKDLSGWGHYLMMGLVGLIIASLVNMFLRSSGMSYLISYAGILLFTGLTAYDTQRIKNMSRSMSHSVDEGQFVKLSILGALTLYLDFINMFLFMLRILGRRN